LQSSYFVDLPDQLTTYLQPYFADVCQYMDDARNDEASPRIVVHCQHGQSRSGALVCAYVMHHKRWNLKQTITHVFSRRPELKINVAFLSQLQAFEDELGRSVGGPSISLEEMEKMGIVKCYSSIKDPDAVCFGTWKKGSRAPNYTRVRKY